MSHKSFLGFDRNSLVALAVMFGIYAIVFGSWRALILQQQLDDPLLWTIWFVMTVLFCWRVRPRTDLQLAVIGALGGLVIEWWGTTTQVWTYFTNERPPLFIVPAWLVAAVVVNRIASAAEPHLPRRWGYAGAYWLVVGGFVVWMSIFIHPYFDTPSTWAFAALMVAIPFVAPQPRRDLTLFLVGLIAGAFFETWGTTRRCWTYYTHETPPAVAVAAHGFGAVAFAHAARLFGHFGESPEAGEP